MEYVALAEWHKCKFKIAGFAFELKYRVWCRQKGLFQFYNICKGQVNPLISERDMGDRGMSTT